MGAYLPTTRGGEGAWPRQHAAIILEEEGERLPEATRGMTGIDCWLLISERRRLPVGTSLDSLPVRLILSTYYLFYLFTRPIKSLGRESSRERARREEAGPDAEAEQGDEADPGEDAGPELGPGEGGDVGRRGAADKVEEVEDVDENDLGEKLWGGLVRGG